jgi:hypothetical protein
MCTAFSTIPSPTTHVPTVSVYHAALHRTALAHASTWETSPLTSRLVDTAGRIEFLSYGLVVHLLLLPTPPHGDAVIFGYRPESVYLTGTFTLLTVHTHSRTSPALRGRARLFTEAPALFNVATGYDVSVL